MNKRSAKNVNGIMICDSIVMSVRRKRLNCRKLEAVLIAVTGFVSVIMSFLGMFGLRFDEFKVTAAAILFSVFYITLVLIARRALWVILYSMGVYVFAAYKLFDKIRDGFKYVYNIIYQESFHTQVRFYKELKPGREEECVTTLLIFGVWLLALIIYFFTIYRPNPLLPLISTFPLLEIGLYNGIEIPVFWGVLTVAYWLGLLSMSSIDIGEYSGGPSGFVRKDNLFFPKRQMKLKVTEKCGMLVMAVIIITSLITSSVMSISGYKRSDELNRKRKEISQAFDEFTVEDLAASLARISSAFGLKIDYDNNKLGSKDHISYKGTTDLVVTFDRYHNCAVYLKDQVSSDYGDNEWSDLSESAYKQQIFDDFTKNGIFPQDFPCLFSKLIDPSVNEMTVWITSKVKKDRTFSTYGTDNYGGLSYDRDKLVGSIDTPSREFSYKFVPVDADFIAASTGKPSRTVYSASAVNDEYWRDLIRNFADSKSLFTYDDYFPIDYELPADQQFMYMNGKFIMGELLEKEYRDFVYDQYLDVPDDNDMSEVRAAYSDLIAQAQSAGNETEKIAALDAMRERMADTCTYTLSPGKTPSNRDFVNYFLIENQKGYCIHYTTAGVILARMAGVPARYASGYVVLADDFNDSNLNDDGSYTIDVKDDRSHAWVEIYLDGYGWVPFEFTAGYSSRAVNNQPPPQSGNDPTEPTEPPTAPATTTGRSESGTTSVQSTTTTTVSSADASEGGSGTNKAAVAASTDHDSFHLPPWVKTLLLCLGLAAAAAACVFLRRKAIVSKRRREMSTGRAKDRIGSMYDYAEDLLRSLKISNDETGYNAYARHVESLIGGSLVEKGSFEKFMKIALRSGFSEVQPDSGDVDFCGSVVRELSENIYNKSGFFRRLWLKLGSVLV